jgi:predicted nucleic acid-binding protein
MSAAEAFFDTSVLLYLLTEDNKKADRVEELLQRRGVITVQVLNELSAVALRKQSLSLIELREFLAGVREFCSALPLTVEHHELGLDVTARYGFSLYDSMIVAAALHSGCRTLYSEDLQHGQVIGKRLRVVNPFAARTPTAAG